MKTSNVNQGRAHPEAIIRGWVSSKRAGSTGITFRDATTTASDVHDLTVTGGTVVDSGDGTAVLAIDSGLTNLVAITPAQLTANTDDWNPTDLATADIIRASTDASRNLTGITASATQRVMLLGNVGAFDLVLKHNVTSTAANRFYCPNDADYTLKKDTAVWLVYDPTSSRWRVVDNLPAHATTHQSGGFDAIKLDDLATPDDNTDLNATTGAHGLLLKLDGSSSHVLRGNGTWGTVDSGLGVGFHGCRAYADALTITNGAEHGVRYNHNDYDTDNFHFTSNAALTGTVAKTSGSAAIVGTGTSFTTELNVNQAVQIPGTTNEIFIVRSITDNTHFTAWQLATASASGQTGTRRNDVFAIPAGRSGYYRMRHSGAWDSNTANARQWKFYKNPTGLVTALVGTQLVGTVRAGVSAATAIPGNLGLECSATEHLDEGEYIVAALRQASGSDRTYSDSSDIALRASCTIEAIGT